MIIDVVDGIISNINDNIRFGEEASGLFVVQWCSWDNIFNRVVVVMFSILPELPLNGVDLTDALNRFNIVWGTRSHEFTGEGVITIESLEQFGDPDPSVNILDVLDDNILR